MDILWVLRAAMRSPRADRRVLCTLRDALPVWDVGRGLRADSQIVAGICQSRAGRAHKVDLATLVSEIYFVSSFDLTECRLLFFLFWS